MRLATFGMHHFFRYLPAFALIAAALVGPSSVWADNAGERIDAPMAHQETTAHVMARAAFAAPPAFAETPLFNFPDRALLPDRMTESATSRDTVPALNASNLPGGLGTSALTTSLSFNAVTSTDVTPNPPNASIGVGPSQIVVATHGRIRSFGKNGVADGVLNLTTSAFFGSVLSGVTDNPTIHPHVRYDRFTSRWMISALDLPCSGTTPCPVSGNRWLLAVSDAASNGVITASTVWTYFFFQPDLTGVLCIDASLGVDVNALYVGCNMYSTPGAFVATNGYVVQKSSILGAGPMVVTRFAGMVGSATGAGPLAPRGVDNHDPNATEGYFIGVDNATFSTLVLRRVSNPGSTTPTLSSNLSVTVPTTTFPGRVDHAGNTGGTNGQLANPDDRLHAAMIRNGRLWTAHSIRVNATGVASTTAASARSAVRWYQLQNLASTPSLFQSGTIYDSASVLASARQYFAPSMAVSGQGHALTGFTMAGTPVGATAAYAWRLATDSLGFMNGPPNTAAITFGTSTANYNPVSDTGGASGRRWGVVSATAVDPIDDMTMYTVQQYNHALDSFALRVARVAAPPPPALSCATTPVSFSGPTGNITLTAQAGSRGFYDPGVNLPAPARAFAHIAASVSNAVVHSVTYLSPTDILLNITAQATGPQNVTITNPDGQSASANACINVIFTNAITTSAIPSFGGTLSCTPNPVPTGSSANCTATPAAGLGVVGWSGTCGGVPSGAGNVNYTTNTVNADCSVNVRFGTPALNVDNSDAPTTYDPATDGVLLLRYLLGYRGAALIADARGNGGTLRDANQIESHLLSSLALLDVDGDGNTWAHTDGIMILRRLLNPTVATTDAAAMSAITAGAKRGSRTDAEIVIAIDALKP